MEFTLEKSIEIIERTPAVLSALLKGLDPDWTEFNEGENTWSAKEVVAHLIVCEQSDWIPRFRLILSDAENKTFTPIDMQVHFEIAKNNSLEELLSEFEKQRTLGISELLSFKLGETDYKRTGIHPKLGEISFQQLISTWVTHDLTHIAQITRVIAKQNVELVGRFKEFLKILNQ